MKWQTRRTFIGSLLYTIITTLSLGVCAFISGFSGKKRSSMEQQLYIVQGKGRDNSNDTQRVNNSFEPSYMRLHKTGELKKRGEELWEILLDCKLCPRLCGDNKLLGKKGDCQATHQLEISSFHPHFGEERPLVGRGGSGTIFFTNCALRCVFCINWEISQGGYGTQRSLEELAAMMLYLQKKGCHNINFVTPTHYAPHIVFAVDFAAKNGLRLPLVYNTHGYERVEILRRLDGIIDIYLPDFKYWDGEMAEYLFFELF